MGRHLKDGLDYFSLDTTSDRKWKLIKSKFGLFGIGLVIELLKTIYAESYFYKWDEDSALLFAGDNNIDIDKVYEVVDFCVHHDFFSHYMLENYGVLTSSGIQKRYFEACWRRKKVVCLEELMLIEPQKPDWSKTEIIKQPLNNFDVIGNSINSIGNQENSYKNTQRKGNRNRKESINTTESPTAAAEPHEGQIIQFSNSEKPNNSLSPLKDETANEWQNRITEIQPPETWANFAKERKHLNDLGKKTRALFEITPFGSEAQLIDALIKKYLDMREREKGNYWRAAPVTPSGIITRWDKVTTAIAQEWQESEEASRYDAAEAAEFF